jgi:hypothetical protein
MRNIIKKVLREYALKEAEETNHLKCRYINRVVGKPKPSPKTTNVKDKIGDDGVEHVDFVIELVKKIDFPKNISFTINLAYAPGRDLNNPKSFDRAKGFYFNDPNDECTDKTKFHYEDSWGHYLWLVVENNAIVTILINTAKPNLLREVKIERLIENLNSYFGLDIKKNISSIKNLKQINLKNEKLFYKMISSPEKLSKDEKEISLDDFPYIVNFVEKTIRPKNKPKEKQKIEDFVELLLNAKTLSLENQKTIEFLFSLI